MSAAHFADGKAVIAEVCVKKDARGAQSLCVHAAHGDRQAIAWVSLTGLQHMVDTMSPADVGTVLCNRIEIARHHAILLVTDGGAP